MPEVPLVMPKMSMTMESGEVVGWRKRAGDPVAAGEVVCEVLTDKVDMEVESPVAGTIARIVVDAQATVPVGQPLAFITTDADDLLAGLFDPPTPAGGAAAPEPPAPEPPAPEPPAPEPPAPEPPAPESPEPEPPAPGETRTGDAGAVPAADAGPGGAGSAGGHSGPDGPTRAAVAVRATPPSRKGPVPALPGARRRAAELGVRLDGLTGSGPGGAIAVEDVERAAGRGTPVPSRPDPTGTGGGTGPFGPAPTPVLVAALAAARGALAPPTRTAERRGGARSPEPAPPAPLEPAPPAPPAPAPPLAAGNGAAGVDPGFADALTARRRSVRAAVNRAMTQSATVPQFTVFADLDLGPLAARRGRTGWTALLVRALAMALRDAPNLNALSTSDGVREQEHVGVALAADTPVGLLAPVLHDPDRMPVAELDAAVRRTVERARSGRLSAADLDGATVTVSNLGGWQVTAFQALLTPPQAAVLSIGAIGPRPVVTADGGLAARTTCTVGLTVDHRAADGADAARLLAALRELVSDPRRLLA